MEAGFSVGRHKLSDYSVLSINGKSELEISFSKILDSNDKCLIVFLEKQIGAGHYCGRPYRRRR